MIFFNSMNEAMRVIFIALCAVGFIGQLSFLCFCVGRRKNIVLTVVTAVITVLSCFNVIRLSYGAPVLFHNSKLINDDFSVIVTIAANISLGTIALILSLAEINRSVASPTKIPQYLEYSKDGVLFSDKRGLVLLANHKIRELAKTITGTEIENANNFRNAVFSAKSCKQYTVFNIDGKLIFRLPDGLAWEFAHTQLDNGSYIITATDATQLLDTAEKITTNKKLIKETKNRLQWTLDNLDGLKTQNEISEQAFPLRAQIRDYANALYESIESDEIIPVQQVGKQLIPAEKMLPLIINAFEIIGVSIRVIGSMPADAPRFAALLELLFVSASSAVSHCRAELITMAIYEGGNKLTANINCDGTLLHSDHIGAFDDIKSRIDSLGGTLTITKEPSLKLSVMLLK